ncbi:thioredoxin family protein [Schlesneria paludicola]|uniref:thioredoxin family protein n=1 Tax=Schlesneria paludicola TaxID=360056 RepID=UPI00029A3B18|nr:thioredoxin family protein [Schlesneria paludicola]
MSRNTNWSKRLKSVFAVIGLVGLAWSHDGSRVCSAQTSEVLSAKEEPTSDTKQLIEDVRKLREEMRQLSDVVERHLARTPAKPIESPLPQTSPATAAMGQKSILLFTATWCGPCQQQQPIIAKLKREGFPIRVIDIDLEGQLTRQYNIMSIPCVVVEDDGKETLRFVGQMSDDAWRNLIEKQGFSATAKQEEMHQRLSKPVSVVCANQAISEGLRQIKQQAEIDIVIDEVSLEKAGVSPHRPIYFAAMRCSARSALQMLLSPRKLDFAVYDNVVVVTGKSTIDVQSQSPLPSDKVREPFVIEAYSIADLVNPAVISSDPSELGRPAEWLKLIEHMKDSVDPGMWEENGGQCTIKPYPGTNSLIVRATGSVHDQLHESLERLRRGRFVMFETRFLTVPEKFAIDQAGLKANSDGVQLDGDELLEITSYAEQHGGTWFVQPAITIPNGEVSELLGPRSSNLQMHFRGLILRDKDAFRLSFSTDSKQILSQLMERSYEVSNGKTLLIPLNRTDGTENRDEPADVQYLLIRPRRLEDVERSECLIKKQDLSK